MSTRPSTATRPRHGDVGRAWRLDRHSFFVTDTMVVALLLGLSASVLWLFMEIDTVLVGALFGMTPIIVSRPWDTDEKAGGARLRRIVGLPRRSVVTARYLETAAVMAVFVVTAAIGIAVTSLLTGRDPAEAWFALWMAACVGTVLVAVSAPSRIRWGLGPTWFVAVVAGAVSVALLLLLAAQVFGGWAITSWGDAGVALVVFGALVAVCTPLSHRVATRLYERKDL